MWSVAEVDNPSGHEGSTAVYAIDPGVFPSFQFPSSSASPYIQAPLFHVKQVLEMSQCAE